MQPCTRWNSLWQLHILTEMQNSGNQLSKQLFTQVNRHHSFSHMRVYTIDSIEVNSPVLEIIPSILFSAGRN